MSRAPLYLIGLFLSCLATSPGRSDELKDLYFGEALFYAYQGQYFEALQRLDTELAQYHGLDEPGLPQGADRLDDLLTIESGVGLDVGRRDRGAVDGDAVQVAGAGAGSTMAGRSWS